MMKYFFRLLLLAITTTAFTYSFCQSKTAVDTVKTIVPKQAKPLSNDIKKTIRHALFKKYYNKSLKEVTTYGGGGMKLKVDSSEGFIDMYYAEGNKFGKWGPNYQITSFDDFIEGDLNNDGYNDLVVCIPWTQGSRPRLDIHCYITINKRLTLYKVYTANNLGICNNNKTDTSGRFFPSKIENGFLIGKTDCLQRGDPGCCPSLEMLTYFKFNKGLQFAKQEAVKKD